MSSNFRIDISIERKPPRLKDLINAHVMGDVWVRDTSFGLVTDSIILAKKFDARHDNILRAIAKCRNELSSFQKYELEKNLIDNTYAAGFKGRKRTVDISEFGLALLLLYINNPKARQISAEILYRFFVLQTYVKGLNERQIGVLKGYYRQQMKTLKSKFR